MQLSTPPNLPGAAASAEGGPGTSTGSHSLVRRGVTSSSGIGSFVQDLDVVSSLPAYQRKVTIQRLSLGSGSVSGAQGGVGGTSRPDQVDTSAATAPVGSGAATSGAGCSCRQQVPCVVACCGFSSCRASRCKFSSQPLCPRHSWQLGTHWQSEQLRQSGMAPVGCSFSAAWGFRHAA